ncbi:hypothetical protein XBO1_2360004 [Xenorhabdus bovienii str. oregonense]|uniref:Uncharacterized protein n=1 Tax=Xenorhabdus bovienii str. oregonense TaxID=1398202 RepID=A0A077NWS0_XENBV|nr:hypothetical protein XBO1_2360004 [Xenorhabdus bovienii str. oregonense]
MPAHFLQLNKATCVIQSSKCKLLMDSISCIITLTGRRIAFSKEITIAYVRISFHYLYHAILTSFYIVTIHFMKKQCKEQKLNYEK